MHADPMGLAAAPPPPSSRCATELGFPVDTNKVKGRPVGEQGGCQPLPGAKSVSCQVSAWRGAWGLRLSSKAEEEALTFSRALSAGTPASGKFYLVSPRISSPRVSDCGPRFIRPEAGPCRGGCAGGGGSLGPVLKMN